MSKKMRETVWLLPVLYLLTLVAATGQGGVAHKQPCFPSLTSLSKVAIDFEIVPGYVYFPGHFNFASNISHFREKACPVETILHSCYLGNISKALQLERERYVASPTTTKCSLEHFIPGVFLDRIRHRQVLFVGDSLMLQMWQMLICSLHGSTEVDYDIEWFNHLTHYYPESNNSHLYHICPFGTHHCYILSGKVYYPRFNATIAVQMTHVSDEHGKQPLQDFIDKFHLHPEDVVLFNFGLHFNNMTEYKELLHRFVRDYRQTKRVLGSQMPVVIWRETTPQHFSQGGPAGYFQLLDACGTNYTKDSYYQYDYRNRLMDELLESVLPIMRFVNSTFLEVHAHIDMAMLQPPLFDCSHYCLPSNPLYIFRDLLFNVFHVLKERVHHHRDPQSPPSH